MRTPSWCDRILYRKSDREKLNVKLYDVDMNVKTSDHKPVKFFAQLTKIKYENVKKKDEVIKDLLKTLDKFENDSIPDVKISSH